MAAAQSCHSQQGQCLSVWAQISRVQHWKNDLHYHGLCHALLLHQGLVHTEQLVSCSIFMAPMCARNAHVTCRYTEIGMQKVLLNWGTARGGHCTARRKGQAGAQDDSGLAGCWWQRRRQDRRRRGRRSGWGVEIIGAQRPGLGSTPGARCRDRNAAGGCWRSACDHCS